MSARTARIALTALAAIFLIAADAPETRLEQYQRLRREGVTAAQAGELPKARAALEAALALYPDVAGSYIRLARVQAAAGDHEAALKNLTTYAFMGHVLDVDRDPALKTLMALPGYAEVAAKMAESARPAGEIRELTSISGEPEFIGEGLANDGKGWLLSTVSGRTILRIGPAGGERFLEADGATGALFGMAADTKRGLLWAAEAWGQGVPGGSGPSRTGLLKVSLAGGRILARFALPDSGGKHQLGDVAIAGDGAVYATDSVEGGVWRLQPDGAQLERVVAPGQMMSPQGMAFCPGETAMIVADYSTGLHRVELASGKVQPLGGLRTGLAGTDGLVAAPDFDFNLKRASPLPMAVIVTQNGVLPQRVMLLRISPDCRVVEDAAVLAAGRSGMDDLTLAAVSGDEVVFVGHARWAARGADGRLTTAAPAPIQLWSLTLPGTLH